jgi:DNA-directed RNA polymerase subunit M/transcription elongation factor TFIIS
MNSNNIIKIFKPYMSKLNAEKLTMHIESHCYDYAEEHNAIFLLEEIINTKVHYLEALFQKNNFLKNAIKKKKICVTNLCYLPEPEIDPEKFKNIIEKRHIEELRKSQQESSSAFTCKKCGSKRSRVTERQTRAGDEPATIYVTCLECEHVIRF